MEESDYSRFRPEVYLEQLLSNDEIYSKLLSKKMDCFHEVFAGGKIKGRRLLDIGTGPTIHSVISATPHCDSILLSDFTPQNREVLRKWYEGNLDHDFQKIFQYVVDKEGNGECPVDRQNCLKSKISGIVPIDLKQDDPLAPSWFPKFDVITSSLCLEVVYPDLASYKTVARSVAGMLENSGHIVLYGDTGESFYSVGTERFASVKLTTEQIKNTWTNVAGLKLVHWIEGPTLNFGDHSDVTGFFCMVGKKPMNHL